MNVAIFASAFYPSLGGVEELVRQLAHAFIAKGSPTIILTNRWPRSLPDFEQFEGIPLYRLPFRVPEGSFKARFNYRLTHRAIERQMLAILKRHRIDLMHVQCISSNGYYAMLAKQATGLPLVVTAQGELTMDAGRLYQTSAFANRVLRELLEEADYITGCSRKTLDDVEKHVGKTYPRKSAVIFNGANIAEFDGVEPFAHPRPYILGIGRLVPQKGFDVLIDAYARSGVQTHDLLIAGDGPERQSLEAQARQCGLDGRVRLLGRADRTAAAALFRGCSFFALPSRTDEGLPLVSVEAMAAAKAVIGCAVGGVPESVLDNQTGLLVPHENVDALARGIALLGDDVDLRCRLGEAGRHRAASFDWPAIADQYLELYRRVARRLGE